MSVDGITYTGSILELHSASSSLLDAILSAADARSVAMPSRQVLSAGGVIHDCEQVYVTVLSMSEGLAGDDTGQAAPCNLIMNGIFEVGVVRCAAEKPDGPRGELPPQAGWIENDLIDASTDAAVLLDAIAGTLKNVTVQFLAPQGGMRAVAITGQMDLL